MNKNIYTIGILAATAIAFWGCAKEVDTPTEVKTHTITVTVQAEDSKTAIVEGGTSASYIWSSGDASYFHIKENGVAATAISMSLTNDNSIATFTATFPDSEATEYTYSAYFAKDVSNSGNLKIQAYQLPDLDSFDPSADLLVAQDITESSRPSSLQFMLRRVISMNKMTLKELEEGEKICSVEISSDKSLSGYFVFAGTDKNGNPVEEHYSSEGKKITLSYGSDAIVPTSGEFPVYFACGPQLENQIAVRVVTDRNLYVRNNFTSTVDFQVGVVKRFGVKLGSYGTPLSGGTVYTLVEDDSDLYDGATYLIYGAGYVIGEQKTNNRAAVAVTENNGTITIDNSIQAYPCIIENVADGFAIKDINNNGYLYNHRDDKNYLLNKSEKGDYTTWTISINDGVASIINVDNTSRGIMGFNPNNGSPLFAAYGTIPNGGTGDLALYIDLATVVVLEDPNLSFTQTSVSVEWDDRGNFEAPALTKPSGLTATYSSSNEDVATVDESSGTITFVGSNGSTTITATTPRTDTYKAGTASYIITVTGAPASPGESVDNPLDAAAAIDIMEDLGQGVTSDEMYYVEGTIDAAPSYFGSGKLTFTFVDASDNQIKAYNCLGLNGANFSGKSDLAVGDYVVVYGNLLKYNTTYEITNGQLALLNHPLATPTITFTQPSQAGCSFTVKVDGENIDSGDTVEEGKTVNLAVTVGSGYVFDGWTVNGASVADASATTTSFVVGQSNISISASFHEDIAYYDFTWDLSTDQTVESTSSKLSWYYRGVTMIASKGNSSTPSDNYCPPSQQSTRFYSGETLTISPYSSCTIGYVEFTATSASYATILGNSTWTNASAVVNGTLVTVTPTNGDSAFSAVISGACGFSGVTVYYTGTLATVANRTVTISQPSETGCSIAVTVKGVVVGNGGSVEQGKVVTIEATAGANYSFDSWTVTGATVADASSSITSFSVGASDISISASFTENSPGYTPYSTGFESSEGFTAGTNYQSTVTQGPSGKQWKIYYGTTSTSSCITGSQSLAMRLYTSSNYGYAEMQFDVPGATGVSFKAKAATTNSASIKLTIKESKDGGTTWSTVSGWSAHALTSSAADYSFTVSGTPSQYRIRFEIDSSSTKPSKSNAQLTIDDISISVN